MSRTLTPSKGATLPTVRLLLDVLDDKHLLLVTNLGLGLDLEKTSKMKEAGCVPVPPMGVLRTSNKEEALLGAIYAYVLYKTEEGPE